MRSELQRHEGKWHCCYTALMRKEPGSPKVFRRQAAVTTSKGFRSRGRAAEVGPLSCPLHAAALRQQQTQHLRCERRR